MDPTAQLRAASALARSMRFAKTLGKSSWTEADLEALNGQPESIRREFKSGRMFEEQESKWLVTLSAEVSALANTEGGLPPPVHIRN